MLILLFDVCAAFGHFRGQESGTIIWNQGWIFVSCGRCVLIA